MKRFPIKGHFSFYNILRGPYNTYVTLTSLMELLLFGETSDVWCQLMVILAAGFSQSTCSNGCHLWRRCARLAKGGIPRSSQTRQWSHTQLLNYVSCFNADQGGQTWNLLGCPPQILSVSCSMSLTLLQKLHGSFTNFPSELSFNFLAISSRIKKRSLHNIVSACWDTQTSSKSICPCNSSGSGAHFQL